MDITGDPHVSELNHLEKDKFHVIAYILYRYRKAWKYMLMKVEEKLSREGRDCKGNTLNIHTHMNI